MNPQAFDIVLAQNKDAICNFMRTHPSLANYNLISQLADAEGDTSYHTYSTDLNDDTRRILQFIIKCDPTPKSIYAKWLLRRFLDRDFGPLIEDVGKATDVLERYHACKPRMPIEFRDINTFKNFGALEMYAGAYEYVPSKKSLKVEVTQNLISTGEVSIVHDDDEIKIIIPRTQEAAMHFGKNTRWCTASKNSNMFKSYNSQGPLYIILFKATNVRWQLHFETEQFMDEQDVDLSASKVLKTRVPDLIDFRSFIDRAPTFIKYMRNATSADYDMVLDSHPQLIDEIPKKRATKRRWRSAVSKFPDLALSMPFEDDALVRSLIYTAPRTIFAIASERRTEEDCIRAIRSKSSGRTGQVYETCNSYEQPWVVETIFERAHARFGRIGPGMPRINFNETQYAIPVDKIGPSFLLELHRCELEFDFRRYSLYHRNVPDLCYTFSRNVHESASNVFRENRVFHGELFQYSALDKFQQIIRKMLDSAQRYSEGYNPPSVRYNEKISREVDLSWILNNS